MSESSHVNLSFSSPVVHENKVFKWPTLFLHFWRGLDCSFAPFMQEIPSLIETGQTFHFKRFFPIHTCKNCFPYDGPSQPPGTILCTSLKLHYISKLSWAILVQWFSREKNSMTTQFEHFCDYMYLPFDENLVLYLDNFEFPIPKDDFTKFDWNWPSGSAEEFIQCKHT
jgi:hypothetical protein